jgi:D-serine dehydratase
MTVNRFPDGEGYIEGRLSAFSGVTVATVHQMRVCRSFGADRIILANQAVGRSELDSIAIMARAPDLDFMMIVDSVAGIEAAAEAVRRNHLDRPLQLLLERGYPRGRTGCRTNDIAIAPGPRLIGKRLPFSRNVHP